ncbi:MAG: mechanosensitive ion channel [Xanthomonadales bacterium]|nr:mechanosensitive ion channel [Xanthomonadales bacterium]
MQFMIRFLVLVTLLFLPISEALFAQADTTKEAPVAPATVAPENDVPEDALNRGTPRRSAIGFLEACSNLDYEKAAEFLDLRNLPRDIAEIGGKELARQLNHVLSRSVWLDDYNVSDSAEGAKGDGLPEYRDLLVTITDLDGELRPIWLQKVPRGDGVTIWKISNRSVALVPELYEQFSYSPIVETIRKWFPEDWSFLGLEAFKWFIMLVFVAIAWPLFWLLGWLLSRLFSSPERPIYPMVRRALTGPLVMIGLLVVIGSVINELGAGVYAQMILNANTLSTIAVIWMIWVLIGLVKLRQQHRLLAIDRPGAAKLLQPMSTLLKIVVLIFGLLFWLNNLGFNITTVLAGLGVGGLALALALQKPIEDMMGALSIFSQAPFRVGDLCRYGSTVGTVEEIGLRTTRLRTLTNTIVSIPNAQIGYHDVENLSYREKIRFWPTLRLRYDTSTDQLLQIRDEISDLLRANERVYEEPTRVRITDFEKDAILMKVHCFLKTTDFAESLEIGEELNLGIMRIIEQAGARLALPSATLQLEGGGSGFLP